MQYRMRSSYRPDTDTTQEGNEGNHANNLISDNLNRTTSRKGSTHVNLQLERPRTRAHLQTPKSI
jgi:hypothetical protein